MRRFWILLAAVSILLAATEIAARLRLVPHLAPLSLHALLTNPLFAIGFGCPLVLHVSRWPRLRDFAVLAVAGIALTLLVGAVAGETTTVQGVIGFGLASALLLGGEAIGSRSDRTEALLYLLPALVALIFTLEVAMFLEFISRFHPLTNDGIALLADRSFGSDISFDVGRLFLAHPVLAAICTAIYLAPPPALIFVYALQVKRRPHPPIDVITLLLLSGGIGYALYFLFPVSGPKFAFAGFPHSAPAIAAAPLAVPPAPRNAVPSLHMASALMAWTWARRYGRAASWTAFIFVLGTFLATMGLGEHYFFDLVVAMPFTIAVQALLVPRIPLRRRAALFSGSASLYAIWLAHAFYPRTAFAWVLLAVTLAAYALCERLLGAES